MAARQRGDEGFLRIDSTGIRAGQRHHVGRGGGGHIQATIEAPAMSTTVAVVEKILPITLPKDLSAVLVGHCVLLSTVADGR
ncbi:hypothetical protein FQZ97_1202260 [compost metagenome]